MSVHYKFKSSLDFDTISFDGLHISVADLKKEIINKKKLGKTQDFDLQITNAQTKEEYVEDSCLIPKNTSLVIARVPLATRLTKKAWDPTAEKAAASASARERKNADSQAGNIDLTMMNGTEEEKITAMMKQSTMDFDPRNYQKVRGSTQTGEVPSTYRCYKCQKMGHWIKNCPQNAHHESSHTEIRRSTGIPRSFIDAGNSPATEPIHLPPVEKKQEIPDDLICSICKDLFTDAVMIPCCGSSFCDECVRTALLESEDNECPDCNEKGSSPGSLIPNRFLRNSVNSFKNETGYSKPRQQKKLAPVIEENAQPSNDEGAATATAVANTPPQSAATVKTSAPKHESTAQQPTDDEQSQSTEKDDTKASEHVETANATATTITTPRDGETSRAETPHDESDFEDNITVTVPKPQTHSNNYHDYRERQSMNGRYNRTNINDMDSMSNQSHQYEDKESYGSHDMMNKHGTEMNMNMRYGMQQQPQQQQQPPPSHQQSSQHSQMMQQQMPHRPAPPNQMISNHYHPNAPNAGPGPWWNQQNRYGHTLPAMHQKDGIKSNDGDMHSHQQLGPMHHRQYGPMGSHQPLPQMQHRGYAPLQHQPPQQQLHHRPMHQESNIVATAFQGVASKIGTGIIEDPLAAFEQIMKEKERRKKERRVMESPPPRRRSRSNERRRSMDRRSPRHNSTDSRDRGRSTGKGERSSSRNRDRRNDKRGRSPDRRRSPMDNRRRRRSGSYHSRPSRSYSRSRSNTPPRRHSRTPPRKHSRSPQERRSRSRSGSYSNNRNRYREPGRRDFRDNREEYRERSPNFYPSRGRGSYRGRGRGNYYRQDRNANQSHHHHLSQHHHPHQVSGGMQQPHSNVPYYDQSMNLMNPNMQSGGGGGGGQGGYNDTRMYHDTQPNRYTTVSLHSPSNVHMSGMQSAHDFQPQIGHAIQEIHPVDSNHYGNEGTTQAYPGNNSYDVLPPGVDREPPPPGFENEEQQSQGVAAPRPHSNQDRSRSTSRARERDRDRERENRGGDTRERDTRDREHRSGAAASGSSVTERKHHSKSPAQPAPPPSRERARTKSAERRNQYDKDEKKESGRHVSRPKDLGRKEQPREKERDKDRSARDKEKEKERDKDRDKDKDKDKDRDDEKRERKSKDKKKKKKEEKSAEKKRKKEKKEKRDKDGKKSSKSHSHYSSGNEDRHVNSSDAETHPSKTNTDSHSTTPPPPQQQQQQQQQQPPQTQPQPTKMVQKSAPIETHDDDEGNIDLYGDINIDMGMDESNPNEDFGITSSPARLNRSDSILDIHATVDFEEADLPESESEIAQQKQNATDDTFVALPEPSKWEREDDSIVEKTTQAEALPIEDQTKVTNEVLKRAENAIFARAINAIRPIEIKKICPERQKLYSNETPTASDYDKSPMTVASAAHIDKPSDHILQITLLNSEQERSVEVKSSSGGGGGGGSARQSRTKTPPRSIKERLGKKLNDDIKSRSRTPQRKLIGDGRNDRTKSRSKERRSREHDKRRNDTRDRKYRSPKNENRRNSDARHQDNQPKVGNERTSHRDKERRRNSSDERDSKDYKDSGGGGSGRNRGARDRDDKDTQSKNSGRDDHKTQVDKSTRDTDRDRELQKARIRARIREEERSKAQQDQNQRGRSSPMDTGKDRRPMSNVSGSDRRKRPDSNATESQIDRKRQDIDESNFEPNYEAHPSDDTTQKLKSTTSEHSAAAQRSKTKTDGNRKRSRSYSSSSSSSDSDSDSSSNSEEERKRKRKRKHKKQKKSKKSKKKKKTKK